MVLDPLFNINIECLYADFLDDVQEIDKQIMHRGYMASYSATRLAENK